MLGVATRWRPWPIDVKLRELDVWGRWRACDWLFAVDAC